MSASMSCYVVKSCWFFTIMQHTVPDTEGQMACNGPVGHPTDIIKTDANMHIIY